MARAGERSFGDLLNHSLIDPPWYWETAAKDLNIPFERPYHTILETPNGAPWAHWFVGGTTNLAAICLDRWLDDASREAIVWFGEDGTRDSWTRAELHRQTEALAGLLRQRGIGHGDRVAILLPMVPQAVAAFLAVAKIGAVAVPLFTGFGIEAIRTRIDDAGVAAVLTADAGLRRGVPSPLASTAAMACRDVSSVHSLIVLSRVGTQALPTLGPNPEVIPWPEASTVHGITTTTAMVPTEHQFMIAYTSGTTGKPKGAVHVHGGLPIKVAAEGAYQHDLGENDCLLWVSDMGWIMGIYQIVAALANGARLCLLEGIPTFPTPGRLWEVAEQAGVTTLGLSPTLVRNVLTAGDDQVRGHDLTSLRVLSSTGEPWNERPWNWFFHVVGSA